MKILQIAPRLPYPPDTGGKIDILNFAKSLVSRHQITLACFSDTLPEKKALEYLNSYYYKIETIILPPDNKIKIGLHGIFNSIPYTMQKYHTHSMEALIQQLAQSENFDLVRIDQMHMAPYDRYFPKTPVILRKQNVDAVIMQRFYQQHSSPLIKAFAWNQYNKLLRYENTTCRRFQKCIMITREDEMKLKEICPEAKTSVIPCGMELPDYLLSQRKQPNPYRITFLGSMDWLPNEDAVLYFLEQIWPEIHHRWSESEFYIVGRSPSKRINAFKGQPGITITGYVDDVEPYLENTEVFAVPLRVGSGMRIKILEAMAMGIPIVTTSVGMEGIDAKPDNDLLVADSADSFINAISRIFQNPELGLRISQNAQQTVQSLYSLEAIGKQWESLIQGEIHLG